MERTKDDNWDLDYQFAEMFDLSIDEVDTIPLTVVEKIREHLFQLNTN